MKDVVDMISTSSGVTKVRTELVVRTLGSTVKKYCFIQDTSFSDLQDEYELKPSTVPIEKMHLGLADPPYNSRGARSLSSYAHAVCSRKSMEETVRLTENDMAFEKHEHVICLEVLPYH